METTIIKTKIHHISAFAATETSNASWQIVFADKMPAMVKIGNAFKNAENDRISFVPSYCAAILRNCDERLATIAKFTEKEANVIFAGAEVELERIHHMPGEEYVDDSGTICYYDNEGYNTNIKSVKFISPVDIYLDTLRIKQLDLLASL